MFHVGTGEKGSVSRATSARSAMILLLDIDTLLQNCLSRQVCIRAIIFSFFHIIRPMVIPSAFTPYCRREQSSLHLLCLYDTIFFFCLIWLCIIARDFGEHNAHLSTIMFFSFQLAFEGWDRTGIILYIRCYREMVVSGYMLFLQKI